MSVTIDVIARDKATRTLDKTGRSIQGVEGKAKSMRASMQKTGQSMAQTGMFMSTRLTLPIVGLGAAVLMTAGKFEKSMNKVRAISGATGNDFDDLREQAKLLGRTTQFSATQAAEGMSFLAMAGFEAKDIMVAMPGVLNLAAAGNLELATAADIASNVLTSQGFATGELAHVNDVLAKAFTSANTNLEQLGQAFKFAGPVVAGFNVSFEEATAVMALMGNAGIQASMAGTSLRNALAQMADPMPKQAKLMKKLGLQFKDSAGDLLPIHEILTQLKKSGASASEMMSLFGKRAGPAMLGLLSQTPKALRELTRELENSGGTAEEIANIQLEGLIGALTLMKSALEGVFIAIGDSGLLAAMTSFVKGVAGMFTALAELDPKVLNTIVILLGIVAVVGPILLIMGKLIAVFALVLSPIGLIVLAVGALVAALVIFRDDLQPIFSVVGRAFEGLKKVVMPIINTIKTTAISMFRGMKQWWDKHGQKALDTISGAFETLSEKLAPLVDPLRTLLGLMSDESAKGLEAFTQAFGDVPPPPPIPDQSRENWETMLGLFAKYDVTSLGALASAMDEIIPPPMPDETPGQWATFATNLLKTKDAAVELNKYKVEVGGFITGVPELDATIIGIEEDFNGLIVSINETFGTGFGEDGTGGVDSLSGALEIFAAVAVPAITIAIGQLRVAITTILAPFRLAASLIGGLVTTVQDNFPKFQESLQTASDGIGLLMDGDWKGAWDKGGEAVGLWAEGIQSTMQDLGTTLGEVITTFHDDVITPAWEAIDDTVTGIAEAMGPDVVEHWENMKSGITTVVDGVGELVDQDWESHLDNALTSAKDLKTSTIENFNNLKSGIGSAVGLIGDSLSRGWTDMKTGMSTTWTSIKTLAGEAWSGIATAIGNGFKAVVGKITAPINSVIAKIRGMVARVISMWNQLDFHIPAFEFVVIPAGEFKIAGRGPEWGDFAISFGGTGDLIPDIGTDFGPRAQGLFNVPNTGTATLHQNEMVLPAPFAQDLRAALRGRDRPQESGGDTYVTIEQHFGRDSVRNDDDIRHIGIETSRRSRLLGFSIAVPE